MRKTILILTILLFFAPFIASAKTTAKTVVESDSDKDGLIDKWEKIIGTDAKQADSDGDGYKDGTEVNSGYDPLASGPVKKEKLIKVDLKTQILKYFFDKKELDSFPISSGIKKKPTPKGDFKIIKKLPVADYRGATYYYPNTKWNLNFFRDKFGGYYIHGAYWHNKFGTPYSAGCINVAYKDMEKLYNFAQVGTKVDID